MAGSSTEGGGSNSQGFGSWLMVSGPSGATVSDDADLLALAVNNVRGGE